MLNKVWCMARYLACGLCLSVLVGCVQSQSINSPTTISPTDKPSSDKPAGVGEQYLITQSCDLPDGSDNAAILVLIEPRVPRGTPSGACAVVSHLVKDNDTTSVSIAATNNPAFAKAMSKAVARWKYQSSPELATKRLYHLFRFDKEGLKITRRPSKVAKADLEIQDSLNQLEKQKRQLQSAQPAPRFSAYEARLAEYQRQLQQDRYRLGMELYRSDPEIANLADATSEADGLCQQLGRHYDRLKALSCEYMTEGRYREYGKSDACESAKSKVVLYLKQDKGAVCKSAKEGYATLVQVLGEPVVNEVLHRIPYRKKSRRKLERDYPYLALDLAGLRDNAKQLQEAQQEEQYQANRERILQKVASLGAPTAAQQAISQQFKRTNRQILQQIERIQQHRRISEVQQPDPGIARQASRLRQQQLAAGGRTLTDARIQALEKQYREKARAYASSPEAKALEDERRRLAREQAARRQQQLSDIEHKQTALRKKQADIRREEERQAAIAERDAIQAAYRKKLGLQQVVSASSTGEKEDQVWEITCGGAIFDKSKLNQKLRICGRSDQPNWHIYWVVKQVFGDYVVKIYLENNSADRSVSIDLKGAIRTDEVNGERLIKVKTKLLPKTQRYWSDEWIFKVLPKSIHLPGEYRVPLESAS